MDRTRNYGLRSGNLGSIALRGFGFSVLCTAANRGWVPRDQARARAAGSYIVFGHTR